MSHARQLFEWVPFRLLAIALIYIGYPRPAFSADWLELLGLSPARGTPVIVVEARYPGAGAQVVANVLAAPIEQQINGVEGMRHMRSRCTNQGMYALEIVFDKKADQDMAQVLVQNRVALSLPMLPEAVQNSGIVVRKDWPRPLAIVILRSPDGSRDLDFLNREALLNVRDELVRMPGTGQIRCLGQSECGLHIFLKPKEMADHKLTVSDVVAAIKEHDVSTAAGRINQSPVVPGGQAGSHLCESANDGQFARIILRTDPGGHAVVLRDVARFDSKLDLGRVATLGGKPVVALAVYPLPGARPQTVAADLRARLAEIRPRLSKSVAIDAGFEFATSLGTAKLPAGSDYLLIDVDTSDGNSAEHFRKIVLGCQPLLGDAAGVQDVLALPENPFIPLAGPPCLVVRLAPTEKRPTDCETIASGIRSRLAVVKEARLRVRRLPQSGDPAGSGYPVDMAVYGHDADKLRDLTVQLLAHLRECRTLSDVWAESERRSNPQLYVEIDRGKALGRDVALGDISDTLAALGGVDAANAPDRFWNVRIDVGDKPPVDVGMLLIRSRSGVLIPLSALATLRMAALPAIVDRFNLFPMVEVSANPAAGISLTDVRADCESRFAKTRKELGLNEAYRLIWLGQ